MTLLAIIDTLAIICFPLATTGTFGHYWLSLGPGWTDSLSNQACPAKHGNDQKPAENSEIRARTRNGITDESRFPRPTAETTRSGVQVWPVDPALEREFVMYTLPCNSVF